MKKLLVFLLILFSYYTAFSQDSLRISFPNANSKLRSVSDVFIDREGIAPTKSSKVESNKPLISGQQATTYSTLWGWNGNIEMGNGSKFARMEPVQISSENWISVSAGDLISFGVKSDSTLWVWGVNKFGQFGNGTLGDSSLIPKQIGTDKNWKFVKAGYESVYAVKTDGSLWAWGGNDFGVLGDSSTMSRFKPVQIGKNIIGKVKLVSSTRWVTSAISEDGSLWTWGRNNDGALGDGTNIDHYYPVRIGNSGEWMIVSTCGICTLALKTNGTLWGWGKNSDGELGDETKINQNKPIQIGNDSDWSAITNHGTSYLAIKTNGTLWGWGSNIDGILLGDTTIKFIYKLSRIGLDSDWAFVNGSIALHSEAVKKDSTLWYWGSAPWLRKTKPEVILKPTKVTNMGNITKLSTNNFGYQSFFLRNYKATPAKIETLPINKITSNSAECGGNITSQGSEIIYQRGVCYDLRANPKIDNNITEDGDKTGEYQSSIQNLRPFTSYWVRAYVRTAAGDSYGEIKSFTTNLAPPLLIKPEKNKLDVPLKISFIWNEDVNALNYRFQLSKFADFSKIEVDTEIVDSNLYHLGLELNYDYYWRVQAINEPFSSDWSEVYSFHTIKFNEQTLITPKKEGINIPIDYQLKWNLNTKSSSFILQISKDESFNNLILDTIFPNNSFRCSKLDYLKSYFWKVRCFIEQDSSNWSPIWKFTTLMDSVKLTTPEDLSTNLGLTQNLVWEKGIYDKSFRLQVSKDNDFTNVIFDTLLNQKYSADIENLKYYTKYFWRVRNESGDTLGYWSEIRQFKTRMTDVQLIYPENEKTGLDQKIKFIWSAVFGAEFYHLQISKNDQFTDIVYSKDSIKSTEFNVPDLELNTLYYWRVRPWNSESIGTIYWSEVWSFRTNSASVSDGSNSIQIIPNPAGDFITVTLKPSEGFGPSEGSEIHIYNTLGEKVISASARLAVPLRINISDLPKGMYFIRIGSETAKFVKM